MTLIITVVATLLLLFQLVLLARVALDWIAVLAGPAAPRSARGRLSAAVRAVTEPVLAPVRRVLPPLRLGSVALDLSVIVVFLVVLVLRRIVLAL
jgi:YggT family protein